MQVSLLAQWCHHEHAKHIDTNEWIDCRMLAMWRCARWRHGDSSEWPACVHHRFFGNRSESDGTMLVRASVHNHIRGLQFESHPYYEVIDDVAIIVEPVAFYNADGKLIAAIPLH